MGHRDELAVRLGQLARSLQAEDDQELMLDEVTQAAVELNPGADHGSLSRVINHRQVIPEHFTGRYPSRSKQPRPNSAKVCASIYEQVTVRASDTGTEQRWPEFSPAPHALGVRSMLAIQLYVDGDNLDRRLKPDATARLLVEDLDLPLNERCFEKHLESVLKVKEHAGRPAVVVRVVEGGHRGAHGGQRLAVQRLGGGPHADHDASRARKSHHVSA